MLMNINYVLFLFFLNILKIHINYEHINEANYTENEIKNERNSNAFTSTRTKAADSK